jgi:transcriptional regulator with XRE-family HTH domain
MTKQHASFVKFLKEVMRRRKRKPSQLAADLKISHATVSRWLSGEDIPNTGSCRRLADYCGVPVEKVLSVVGHINKATEKENVQWPEFREYARKMYPEELDEDVITMVEDLIERRRAKKYEGKNRGLGK